MDVDEEVHVHESESKEPDSKRLLFEEQMSAAAQPEKRIAMTAAQRKELQRTLCPLKRKVYSSLKTFTDRLAKLSVVEQRALAVIKERERRAAEAAEAARLRLEGESLHRRC